MTAWEALTRNRRRTGSDEAGPQPSEPVRRLPFSVLAKPTGAACNLDCTYCFFLSKELLYDHDSQRMSEAGLEVYLSNLFASQPDGPVEVAWQGGEPTMRGLAFFRRAVELAESMARPRQQIHYAIQTNGTLLDDEWGEFLSQHKFLVGLSMDGPAHLHDVFRVNKAGRGTHDLVRRGWDVLRRHGVETNILCTVHSGNQDHPLEVYRYFRDTLGARYLQFIPIVERVPAEHLELAVADPEALLKLVRHAGAIFLGRHTPEAMGDYLAGPNHVLPTSRTARFSSGLSVLDFVKRTTLLSLDAGAINRLGPDAIALAEAEGLQAHARSIAARLNQPGAREK